MARALGVALAVLLVSASAARALTEPNGELAAGSEESVLRLHDLPPGYRITSDSGCGPSGAGTEGGRPGSRLERRYLKWVVKYRPEGCFYEYVQAFKVPDPRPAPPRVEVETLNTPSEAAAGEGLELYSARLSRAVKPADQGLVTISPSGVQARLIHSRDAGDMGQQRSFLFWRHKNLLGFLQVAGMSRQGNDGAAIHLAGIQQRRMEAPTPYTEAERDDTEVQLDDPGLKFPIYWVGNPFEFGGGPPVELEIAYAGNIGFLGQKFKLDYSSIERHGFDITGWTRKSWKRFQSSGVGEANRPARCTRTTEVDVEDGRATIYGAYDGKRLRPCPRREPDRHYAIAHIGRMVIGVNLASCLSCAPGSGAGRANSLLGMKAIVRALHVRPKSVY